MFKILKHVSKLKLLIFYISNIICSIEGIITSLIVLFLGKIDIHNKTMILIFGFGFIAIYCLSYLFEYIQGITSQAIIRECDLKIIKKSIKGFYNKKLNYSKDELNSLLSQNLNIYGQGYLQLILTIPCEIIQIIISVGYILFINIPIGLLFCLGSLILFSPQLIFNKMLVERGNEYTDSRTEQLSSISDYSKGVNTIRSNLAGKSFIYHLSKLIFNAQQKMFKYYTSHNLLMGCLGPLKGIGYVGPTVIALLTIPWTNLSVTQIIAIIIAAGNLNAPLYNIYERMAPIQGLKSLNDSMLEIINMTDQEIEAPNNLVVTNGLNININNLNKSYDDKVIFSNANAKISARDKVLLSGVSGSGKTTLFSLLCGQDKDYSGTIYFEDEKGEKYMPSYDNVSLIHQTPYIFSATIKENITLFEEYSDEEVIEVLKRVHLWDELGRDLNAQLNGSNLSGGQVMKIEIARCFLRLRPIVLADEVTAALDKENAKEIRELLHTLDTTLIEIAHKYNIEDYNYVYKLENNQLTKLV